MEFEPSNTAMLSMNFLLKYELGILEGKGENAGKNMLMKQIQYFLNLLSIKTIYKNFFVKLVQSVSLCRRLSKKLKIIKI